MAVSRLWPPCGLAAPSTAGPSLLFVVCPHPLDENPARPLVDTVHKTVLYVDPPGEKPVELADQLFVGRWRLEGVPLQDIKNRVSLGPQV